jgi:HD superfamily phosphodiesterase
MPTDHAAVWAAARPYLRARKNDVHVPMAYAYAERLLDASAAPEVDPEVVLLSILLHDIGWAVLDEEAIYRDAFGPGMMESEVRIAHEREGARLAAEILDELGHPAAVRDEVVEIIAGHDTRAHALSPNDELVKDADVLWRFSVAGIAVACDWWGMTPGEYADHCAGQIEGRLFTDAAKAIARAELAESRRVLRIGELDWDARYAPISALAEPYWQTRSNEVHVPGSYALARELLDARPEADPDVVLPAILLHDIGYMAVPAEDHLRGLAGAAVGWDADITRRHEIEGARLAAEILASVGWDPERTRVICDIVDGHDSRAEAVSLEDSLVKDADKLWRFTESGVRTCHTWMDKTPEGFMDWLATRMDEWLFTDAGKALARRELARSRAALAAEPVR